MKRENKYFGAINATTFALAILLASCGSSGGSSGGSSSSAATFTIQATLGGNKNSIVINWVNPENVRSINITRIAFSDTEGNAIAGSQYKEVYSNKTAKDRSIIAAGNITFAIADVLIADRYYGFSIVREFANSATDIGVLKPTYLYLPPPVSTVTASVNDDALSVQLNWINPSSHAKISEIMITRESFANSISSMPMDSPIHTRYTTADAIKAGAASVNTSVLSTDLHHRFRVTPIFTGAGSTGNIIGPTSEPTDRIKLGFKFIELTEVEGGQFQVIYNNPKNVIRIIINRLKYRTLSGGNPIGLVRTQIFQSSNTTKQGRVIFNIDGTEDAFYYSYTISRILKNGNTLDTDSSERIRLSRTVQFLQADLDSMQNRILLRWDNPHNVRGISITRQALRSYNEQDLAGPPSITTHGAIESINIDDLIPNRFYQFTVTPIFDDNIPGDNDTTLPLYVYPRISNVAIVANPDNNSVKLSWENPASAIPITRIQISRQTYSMLSGGNPIGPANVANYGAITNISIPGLADGLIYGFTIIITYEGNVLAPDTEVPERIIFNRGVSNATATLNADRTGMQLSWENPDNTLGIEITRQMYDTVNGNIPLGPPDVTTYTSISNIKIEGQIPDRYYRFNITAIFVDNITGDPVTAEPSSLYLPPRISNARIASSNTTRIRLAWENPSSILPLTRIQISRQDYTDDDDVATIGAPVINNYTDSNLLVAGETTLDISRLADGLAANRYYSFIITPIYEGDISGPTAEAAGRVTLFPSISNLIAGADESTVRLTWTNPPEVVSIILTRESSINIDGTNSNTFTTNYAKAAYSRTNNHALLDIPGLDPLKYYRFRITPVYLDGINGFASAFTERVSIVHANQDIDAFADDVDVDDDGDGLIEIATADELNQIRDDMAGRSFSGNNNGCGGGIKDDDSRITECNGYELISNIDLAPSYDNWQPIGRYMDNAFMAIFEGNNHIIDNLNININRKMSYSGNGLFGVIINSKIRNVHLRNVSITAVIPTTNTGGLAGYAEESSIINSSASGPLISGTEKVGGLVGNALGNTMEIISSYARIREVNAVSFVGGLVGIADSVTFGGATFKIILSYAVADKVVAQSSYAGGLIGGAIGVTNNVNNRASIVGSIALVANITRGVIPTRDDNNGIGGLIGLQQDTDIESSAAITNNITSENNQYEVGGLSGFAIGAKTKSSYAVTQQLQSNPDIRGGLIGTNMTRTIELLTTSSYWDNTVLTPPDMRNSSTNLYGKSKSTLELQTPAHVNGSFPTIYADWANVWCDAATNEFTTDDTNPLASNNTNRFWDLGENNEYPAMNCLPNFTPAEQRAAMSSILNGESPLTP